MSNEEALNTARKLVQEAVDLGTRAGIAPSSVVAPYCEETAAAGTDGDGSDLANLSWCGIPVIVDNDTKELFQMSEPDDDPGQEPAFLVTQSTANLVKRDFERYNPSLHRMVEDWQEAKKVITSKKEGE